jgi:peptide-methionine (S)-S-oxide reductase
MSHETIVLGAGCFWGVEWVFRQVPGVVSATSGYACGRTANPTYQDVCRHTTGHAEVVEVTFDNEVVTLDQVLEVFWAMHDPTQVNRQGPDVGDQYRSVIVVSTPAQRAVAEASRARAQARFSKPVATQVHEGATFYRAEEYHQRYYDKTGHEPYCHVLPLGVLRELGLVRSA